jgi:hypothetical protein
MDTIQAGLGLFFIAAYEHHFSASGREAFTHRTAQLARAADDDRDFAAQRK